MILSASDFALFIVFEAEDFSKIFEIKNPTKIPVNAKPIFVNVKISSIVICKKKAYIMNVLYKLLYNKIKANILIKNPYRRALAVLTHPL